MTAALPCLVSLLLSCFPFVFQHPSALRPGDLCLLLSALWPQADRLTLLHPYPPCMSDGLSPVPDHLISNRLLQTLAASSLPFLRNGIWGWGVGGQEGGGRQRRRPLGLSHLGPSWGCDRDLDGHGRSSRFQRAKANRLCDLGPSPLPTLGLSFPICRMGWMMSSPKTLLVLRATEDAGREHAELLGTPRFTTAI